MKPEDRKVFFEWYDVVVGGYDPMDTSTWFDLEKEKDWYCEMDVIVLAMGAMKFRQCSIKEDNIDPFSEVLTLPSMCMKSYRMNTMPPKSIGVLPGGGYRPMQKQSNVACRWLWTLHVNGVILNWLVFRSALHPLGEVVLLGRFRVDGYDPTTKTVFEFQGCLFHGCPECYPRSETKNPITHQTMAQLYDITLARLRTLRKGGYRVVEMWEHECNKLGFTNFPPWLEHREPLQARDAMRGGRCFALARDAGR